MTIPIALAFESGGDPQVCAAMLEALRAMRVRATVFLDGRWAEANPVLVEAMARDGHEFGNHAYSHPDLTTLPDEQIGEELERTEALAVRMTGRTTRPWFRPPFQQLDDRVRRLASVHGFRCLSRDALDGAHYLGPSIPAAITDRSIRRGIAGAVLTYHLHSRPTLAALPEIVRDLEARGALLGRVSDLPSSPSERAPCHPDFTGLEVDPGYLRMHRPGEPPQMVNLLAMGTEPTAPVDQPMEVGRVAQARADLVVFNGQDPADLPASSTESCLACLGGDIVIQVRDATGAAVCTVYARVGDTVGLQRGWQVTALPSPRGRRAILLHVH